MLAVILKILSVLGILLLVLFGIVLFVVLLVLFMPIVYKADADKNIEQLKANVRIRWLFGFVRVHYNYPEPGRVFIKVLWKTIYDSGKTNENKKKTDEKETHTEKNDAETTVLKACDSKETDAIKDNIAEIGKDINKPNATNQTEENATEDASEFHKTLSQKLFAKYEKIKYTIQQFCDKIKHIWDNIIFYKKLLQDEQTKLLISHVWKHTGKILRHIRPRRLEADMIVGTGSPDTTGYVYGIYSMFSPQLGKNVFVTPDFEQKILVGTVCVAGHVTVFTLLRNVIAILLDKRLRLLLRRLKNHSNSRTNVSDDKKVVAKSA
uniref:hypothetical protein n=1 Tax=Acetatifactor sp. TaxID=1872090 RepID=UPI004057B956